MARNQPWKYALGGVFLVSLASGLAYITKSAASYFIPAIISSSVLLILTLGSIIIGKPLAAWASHLTRGWPLEWFWRKDVKPAYREVTWFWSFLYGIWRLNDLGGPGVHEYKEGKEPPWEGQNRGF